jgi:hypothetical protein
MNQFPANPYNINDVVLLSNLFQWYIKLLKKLFKKTLGRKPLLVNWNRYESRIVDYLMLKVNIIQLFIKMQKRKC